MRSAFHLICLGVLALGATAGEGSRQRVEADIRFLADDLLEGRGTPSRGLDVAALYLASQLRAAGWQPGAAGSYYQTYTVAEFSPQQARYEVSINGQKLARDEFILLPFGIDPGRTPLEMELVFAGFGIVAPEKGIDDLSGIEVRGRGVVAVHGAPWELDPATPFGYDRAIGKSIAAVGRGSPLLVYVSEELALPGGQPAGAEAAFFWEMAKVPLAYIPGFEGRPTMGLGPVLAIGPAVFDRLLAEAAGGSYREWKERLPGARGAGRLFSAKLRLHVDVEPTLGRAHNVVAVWPGEDPALQDEWVVLTAHYDHLGSHPAPEGQDGIWNGADDNASGTAAVLELARRLAASDPPPRRSVLVLLTSGEDRGLLGSAHYSAQPLVPYERVAVNINVDMVGRSDGSVQGIAPGSPGLFARAVAEGERQRIRVLPDQQPAWRILYLVDGYHFARFDVPVIEFFTGIHPDYHQPGDEADKIHFAELGQILEVISALTQYYAGGGERPGFERPPWFVTR